MQRQTQVRVWKAENLPPNWSKRTAALDEKADALIEEDIKAIMNKVKMDGDAALVEFTEKFDKAKLSSKDLRVTVEEIKEAYEAVGKEQILAIKFMIRKVRAFEKKVMGQMKLRTSCNGVAIRSVLRPIESVGCYVPGGRASYPSTLVMTATPAKVAKVPRIVVCSPPNADGKVNALVLVAADLCGVNEIYKVGGAQAIAALTYGTKTIKPVKKIVGPGSRYVTLAKVLVSKDVAIDMPAGPSEILVLADDTADPKFVALDMISQAEHGADSVAGLITTSEKLARKVLTLLNEKASSVERGLIVKKALEQYGFIITCSDEDEMARLANVFASEHVEIITEKPECTAEKITAAGVILLGPYSPVALSDYGSGTNHVFPTGGFGHAISGLSSLDFLKRINVIESSKEGLQKIAKQVKVLTQAENLPNHFKSVQVRFEK